MTEATSIQDFARMQRAARREQAVFTQFFAFLKGSIMSNPLSIETLSAQIGRPTAPQLIDVRRQAAFEELPRMLPGALRGVPEEIALWSRNLSRARPVVVYCVHGHEVGKNAAQVLSAQGFNAQALEGGITAWIDAGLPTIKRRGDGVAVSSWVTRERPKIDRLACPWLVRRFIDPNAMFFYVSAAQVREQAKQLGAQPYDIPDTLFSHRGALCSFDAFLAEYDLHDAALDKLATIVRAADTDQLATAPQASGLLAISLGLCANISDDLALLDAAMPLYDALYAWCKTAQHEAHNWPYGTKPEKVTQATIAA
jgi:rhodanese-related sulfurtransferase